MNSVEVAKEKAIKYIGISKKTKKEVIEKLLSLGFLHEIVIKAVDYLEQLGYINDNEYVKAYVSQNRSFQKYSIYEIIQKLRQKGITEDVYDQFIQILKESDYESQIVERLKKTKLKAKDEMQAANYLYRRGFRIKD